jgi:hypothetical protein
VDIHQREENRVIETIEVPKASRRMTKRVQVREEAIFFLFEQQRREEAIFLWLSKDIVGTEL